MAISSNASPAEKLSPFYKKNEQFCKDFERFIASKEGLIKGKYNAYSYLVTGKITKPANWKLVYKKSTFSSTGNLWLSSKSQSLFVSVDWKTRRLDSSNSNFVIRKKSVIDFLRIILNENLTLLDFDKKYVIETKNNNSKLISKLLPVLKNIFHSGELYQIVYKNNKLIISLRSEKHHFNLFNELLVV